MHITRTHHGLHVEGFPEAVKLAQLSDRRARRLAHLQLHREDLDFALRCVRSLRDNADHPPLVRDALFRSALVTWSKCFGRNEARSSLPADKIYAAGPPRDVYRYYTALRNKHVVHDDNPFAQSVAGAVIGPAGTEPMVLEIVCLSATVGMNGDVDVTNLGLLVETALEWVTAQFDNLADSIRAELEASDHEQLMGLPDVALDNPGLRDVADRRPM